MKWLILFFVAILMAAPSLADTYIGQNITILDGTPLTGDYTEEGFFMSHTFPVTNLPEWGNFTIEFKMQPDSQCANINTCWGVDMRFYNTTDNTWGSNRFDFFRFNSTSCDTLSSPGQGIPVVHNCTVENLVDGWTRMTWLTNTSGEYAFWTGSGDQLVVMPSTNKNSGSAGNLTFRMVNYSGLNTNENFSQAETRTIVTPVGWYYLDWNNWLVSPPNQDSGTWNSSWVEYRYEIIPQPPAPPSPAQITGTTAGIIGFLPLLIGVGIIVMVARKIEDMKSTEDFIAVIVGTGLAIVFLGVFAAIISGLI